MVDRGEIWFVFLTVQWMHRLLAVSIWTNVKLLERAESVCESNYRSKLRVIIYKRQMGERVRAFALNHYQLNYTRRARPFYCCAKSRKIAREQVMIWIFPKRSTMAGKKNFTWIADYARLVHTAKFPPKKRRWYHEITANRSLNSLPWAIFTGTESICIRNSTCFSGYHRDKKHLRGIVLLAPSRVPHIQILLIISLTCFFRRRSALVAARSQWRCCRAHWKRITLHGCM